MVKFKIEPPLPLRPEQEEHLVRVGRFFFFLVGMVLLFGGGLACLERLDVVPAFAVAAGSALAAVAVVASDATIARLQSWFPSF
jgi:hypothetical protein